MSTIEAPNFGSAETNRSSRESTTDAEKKDDQTTTVKKTFKSQSLNSLFRKAESPTPTSPPISVAPKLALMGDKVSLSKKSSPKPVNAIPVKVKTPVTSLETATGAFKLGTMMMKDVRHGSSEPSSSNNSPKPEFATVWKRPLGNSNTGNASSSYMASAPVSASHSASPGSNNSPKDQLSPKAVASPLPVSQYQTQTRIQQVERQEGRGEGGGGVGQGRGEDGGEGGDAKDGDSAIKSQSANTHQDDTLSEEEMLKRNGIVLTHRLSTAEISQRQFNWDDDEDEEQWRKELENEIRPMIEKQHEQQEQERLLQLQQQQQKQQQLQQLQLNKPKALLTGATTLGGSPSSHHPSLNKGSGDSSSNSTPGPSISSLAPWSNSTSTAQQSNIIPIGEQIKELSERKQREQQLRQQRSQNTPHYNYRLSDNQFFGGGNNNNNHHHNDQRFGGPPDDGRYRYHDYERRYRSDIPPPRQELYNANNGSLEPAPMRPPSGPRIHQSNYEEDYPVGPGPGPGPSRRRPSFDRSRSPMHTLTPPPGPPSSRRRSSIDKYPGLESRRLSVGGPALDRGRGMSPNRYGGGSRTGSRTGSGSEPGAGPGPAHSPGPPRRLSTVSTTSSSGNKSSILEEQEQIMKETRERARKRKEEELQREKEREQHARMRAEEIARKMQEREKKDKGDKGDKGDKKEGDRREGDKKENENINTINTNTSGKPTTGTASGTTTTATTTAATTSITSAVADDTDLLAERHVLKSLDSIINYDNDKHDKSIKSNKLWDSNRTTTSPTQDKVAWNFTSTNSAPTTTTNSSPNESRNNLWGPVRSSSSGSTRFSSGIYPRDSKTNGLFDDNSTNFLNRQDKGTTSQATNSRRIIQRDQWNDNSSGGGSWRSVSASSSTIDTTPTNTTVNPIKEGIQQSQSTPLSPVATASSFGNHETTPNGSSREMSRFFPISQDVAFSNPESLLLLSPNSYTKGEDLFNGYSERSSSTLSNIQSPPRVVFPHNRLNQDDDSNSFKHAPSLDSIQAVQTSIAAKLGSKMFHPSPAVVVGGPVSSLPLAKSPVISSLPVEENIEIPPLLRERGGQVKSSPSEVGLKIQSYDEYKVESTRPHIKINTNVSTNTASTPTQTPTQIFSTVTIPRREFSTSAYYRDSFGYIHRREFESDESATAQYTIIQLPNHEKISISKYSGNRSRNSSYYTRGWSRPSASRRIIR